MGFSFRPVFYKLFGVLTMPAAGAGLYASLYHGVGNAPRRSQACTAAVESFCRRQIILLILIENYLLHDPLALSMAAP